MCIKFYPLLSLCLLFFIGLNLAGCGKKSPLSLPSEKSFQASDISSHQASEKR